jgi:hypothetical protein
LVLEEQCGDCHIDSLPTALPNALAVFNLRETEWSARMTPAQLRQLPERLDVTLPKDEPAVTPNQLEAVRRFVASELAAAAPATVHPRPPPK